MPPDLALKAISHAVIAICFLTLLFVLLISLRKELSVRAPTRGIVHLSFAVIGVCTFIALMAAYFQARKMILPQSKFQRLDYGYVQSQQHSDKRPHNNIGLNHLT